MTNQKRRRPCCKRDVFGREKRRKRGEENEKIHENPREGERLVSSSEDEGAELHHGD